MNFLHQIPLIKLYNLQFLTGNRARQYALLTYILENNIVHWEDVNFTPSFAVCSSDDLIHLDFFADWLVGFTSTFNFILKFTSIFSIGLVATILGFTNYELESSLFIPLSQAVLVSSQVDNNTKPKKTQKSKVGESVCTDLVVWGTNLRSTVVSGRITKQVRDMIVLAPYQYSVIVGLLLSDGTFWKGSTNKSQACGAIRVKTIFSPL